MGKGFDTFMENPYWKGIYENAPSTYLQEYYRIMFDTSPFVTGEKDMDEASANRLRDIMLDKADIEYLLENAGIVQAKMHYAKCLDVLREHGDCDYIAASSFRADLRNPWYAPPAGK